LQWVWGAKLLLPFDLIFVLWLLSIRVISQPRTVPLEDSSSSLVRAVGPSLQMVPVVVLSSWLPMVVLVVPSLQWVWGAKLLLPFDLIFVLWLLSIRVILQPRTVPLEETSSSLVRAVGLSLPMVPVVGLSFCPVGVELPSFYPVVQQEELSFWLEGLLVVVSWRLVQEVAPFFCRVGVGLLSFYPVVQQEELSFYPVGVQEELSFYPVGVQEELSFYPVVQQEDLYSLHFGLCRAALEVPSSSLTLVAAPGVPSLRLLVFLVVVPVLSFSHREERAVW